MSRLAVKILNISLLICIPPPPLRNKIDLDEKLYLSKDQVILAFFSCFLKVFVLPEPSKYFTKKMEFIYVEKLVA